MIHLGHRCKCDKCGSTLKHKYIIFCGLVKQEKGCLQSNCINYYLIKIYSMETRKLWIEAEQIFEQLNRII